MVATCGLSGSVNYDEGDSPAFCAGPPCRAGEGEDRVSYPETWRRLDRPLLLLTTGDVQVQTAQVRGSIVQELCESQGGRPGPSVLTSLLVSVDVKLY